LWKTLSRNSLSNLFILLIAKEASNSYGPVVGANDGSKSFPNWWGKIFLIIIF